MLQIKQQNMKVQYYRTRVYGKETLYLVKSEIADTILDLIGQKTILKHQMESFSKIGIVFEEVISPALNIFLN